MYAVDADRESRVSASLLLRAFGLAPRPFAGVLDFIASLAELQPAVILSPLSGSGSDVYLLLAELREREAPWPVIVLADKVEVSEAVALMKLGAFDVIEKPIEEQLLKEVIEDAHKDLVVTLATLNRMQRARALINALSPREIQVLQALLAGHPNKRVADLCGISVRTVEMHRANLLERLGVETLVGAVRIALEARVEPLDQDSA